MDFNWQDVDPDLRMFAIWGVLLIAGYLFLGWCGLWQEPRPPETL